GKRFLSASPQGVPHEKYRFQNVYSAGYFEFSGDVPKNYREWDLGFDFYAPQTFDAPGGRKILIAWEGIGDIPYTNPTVSAGRQHCLTLPRELTLNESGAILQSPVKELEGLRYNGAPIADGESRTATLPFEYVGTCGAVASFDLGFMRLEYKDGEFSMVFTSSDAGCGRDERRAKVRTLSDIRIIADTSSIEVYLNRGATVLSSRIYPADTDVQLTVRGSCGTLFALNEMKFKY
ncbi:MAG: GH32 C-terminal domain-containing protein, partial [Clostridia bacterium]|nr:GH32 C-terminal domain-containing protein [Clostridia bacterium]